MTPQEKLARFEQEISPHLGSAYNLARWLMRSQEDAEDAVQEAFLRAFSAMGNLRGQDTKPWLLTIVRNTCFTRLKKIRNAAGTVALEEELEQLSEPSPDPERTLIISSDREQVRKALEELPPDFREAIVLRELEGLSYKEIASATGIPLGTVMSRLARGRDWLKRILLSPGKEPA